MGHPTGDGTEPVLRVVLEFGVGGSSTPLHGTARVSGSSGAQEFASALDLLRILERAAARARAGPMADSHHGGELQ